MAAAYHLPVTAAQVGTYFVGQYYQMLQSQPNLVHQFYNESSTMLRIDGNTRESATDMLQIHELIMSLDYVAIEIKTAHSLESWNNGVLVMVSGSVRLKEFNGRKKFIETFFLAPQEKGFFVLNDMFHYVNEEQVLQHQVAYVNKSNFDSSLHTSSAFQEQVSEFMLNGDFRLREFQPTVEMEKDILLDNYSYPAEEQIHQVSITENIVDDSFALHSNGSLRGTINSLPDNLSSHVQEPVTETQKHTYASILQVSKGHSVPPVSCQGIKPTAPSDWQQIPEASSHPFTEPSDAMEGSGIEFLDEPSPFDDEVEFKSVYVRNVPTNMSASEIGEEFKKFGRLRPEGVAIRSRKDIDVCYAFVEFEDASGVQNAIKASTVQIAGHQLYIEGRRLNKNVSIRGGRGRGRGRVSYGAMDGGRGRFGSRGSSGGGGGLSFGMDRDYGRAARGNGFYRPASSRQQQGNRNDVVNSSSE